MPGWLGCRRRKVEMSLLYSESSIEIYQSIIENNPDAIFIISANGIIQEINQVVTKMLGYAKDEIQGIHFREILVPEFVKSTNQQFVEVLEGFSREYETQLFHKNGEIIYLQVKNIPLEVQGEIVGVFGVAKDMTELIKTKASLTQMEERMKSFFHSVADPIDILDLNGNVLDVNPAFEEVYGWKKEEVIGHPLPIIPANRYQQQKDMLEQVKRGKHIKGLETICIKKDGSMLDVRLTLSPIQDKKGNIVATSCISRDVTERKKLELSLKESEERYRKVVELSPKGIVIHRDGIILYANPSALKIVREENAIGKSIFSYIHPDYQELTKKRLIKAIVGKELPFVEIQMTRIDGEVIFTEIVAVAINVDGTPATLTMFRDVTDRKKTEQALEESEKRYRRLVEYSPESILVHRNGRIQYANQACIHLLGANSLLELVGKPILDFSPPKYIEIVENRVRKLNQAGMAVPRTEETVVRLDGKVIEVEVTGISLSYNGQPSVLMMIHDISRRKKTEEALRESEEKYRLIAESMSDLVGVLDAGGRVIYASPSHKFVLGLVPEVYEGNLAFDVVHPDDVTHLKQEFESMVSTTASMRVEFRLKNANGDWIWFEAKGRPVYNDDGNLLHYIVVARDITERKRADEDLKQSEEKYRLITEKMTDFVCTINKDGFFSYASHSHESVLGFSSELYEGTRPRDWMHMDDIEQVQHHLDRILNSKQPGDFEFRFRDKQGNWIWFEAKVTPVFDQNGHFQHFLLVSRDIMERKMYEEKLNHMAFHDTLTGIPNRRLFKERLKQSIEEAERYKRKMAVMYMDLDKFKQINDTLGHDIGDELLKQFSIRVKNCLRECDTLSRQGGDEFIILLPEIQKKQDALKITQRILNSLQEPWVVGEHRFTTTSSIGIAFYPSDGITRHELMKSADRALYVAKAAGRNNFKTYSII